MHKLLGILACAATALAPSLVLAAPIDDAQDVAKALNAYAGRGVIRMFFERAGRIYSTDFMIR